MMDDKIEKEKTGRKKKMSQRKVIRIQLDMGEKTMAMLDEIVKEYEMSGRAEAIRMLIWEYYRANLKNRNE